MHLRVMIASLLLAGIVVGGLLFLKRTDGLCVQTSEYLRQADLYLLTDLQKSLDALCRAEIYWQKQQDYLSSLVTHDRLDDVSRGLVRAKGFAEIGAPEEARGEIRDLIRQLTRIREYDSVSVKRLF